MKKSKLLTLVGSVGLAVYVGKLIKENVKSLTINVEPKGKLLDYVSSLESESNHSEPVENKNIIHNISKIKVIYSSNLQKGQVEYYSGSEVVYKNTGKLLDILISEDELLQGGEIKYTLEKEIDLEEYMLGSQLFSQKVIDGDLEDILSIIKKRLALINEKFKK